MSKPTPSSARTGASAFAPGHADFRAPQVLVRLRTTSSGSPMATAPGPPSLSVRTYPFEERSTSRMGVRRSPRSRPILGTARISAFR